MGLWVVALALAAGNAFGQGTCGNQGSCFLLNGGCGAPLQPNQCFPNATGPTRWMDCGGMRTTQERFAAQSPLSFCHGPVGTGGPPQCCTSFHPPASSTPSVTLRIDGTRIFVDYQAPNYYCQNTGDWPPFYTCTNDPLASSDNLLLFLGPDPSDFSAIVSRAFIYYEDATWDTGIDIPCGETLTYSARIGYAAEPLQLIAATDVQPLTGTCKDKRMCGGSGGSGGGGGGGGGGFGTGVGSRPRS